MSQPSEDKLKILEEKQTLYSKLNSLADKEEANQESLKGLQNKNKIDDYINKPNSYKNSVMIS